MGGGHDFGVGGGGGRSRPFIRKAPDWLKLWAFGRQGLGLSDREFWHLTLTQLNALIKAYNAGQRSQDYRTGLICALLANIHRDPKKSKAYKPEDFMPNPRKAPEKMSDEKMLSQLKLMNASLGGETHE